METETITVDCSDRDNDILQILAGNHDANLEILAREFRTSVVLRGHTLKFIEADPARTGDIRRVIELAFELIDERMELTTSDMAYLCSLARSRKLSGFSARMMKPVAKTRTGKVIYPRTKGQGTLCEAYRTSDITFAVGAAGTGKTYLAVAYAVDQLRKEKTSRIILTRPAVEAGESLGFLPGDMKEKVDPYLRPLYDALYDTLGQETTEKFLEREIIEIAPLAFMRGRTLNDAIVILDEAQNATKAQMKMFLTRLGKNAKMIVTGDITQIDLIRKQESGLVQACNILDGIDGISVVRLSESDVVRHPLVAKIIAAYSTVE